MSDSLTQNKLTMPKKLGNFCAKNLLENMSGLVSISSVHERENSRSVNAPQSAMVDKMRK